jgi:hypothetical protein
MRVLAVTGTLLVVALASVGNVPAHAQAGAAKPKPATAAPTTFPPRTPDGHPDLQGLWAFDGCTVNPCATYYLESLAYLRSIGMPERPFPGVDPNRKRSEAELKADRRSVILDPPSQILPYQPWAKPIRDAIMKDHLHPSPPQIDPQTRGWPNGVPRENYYSSHDGFVGGPIQILQPPGFVVFLYETHHEFRIVPLDGRPHPGKDIKLWEADSRGHWEGDTLVIDVTNHHDSTRLDVVGDFHSDAMRVTERWTLVDRNTLDYKATIDDPKVYTQPFTIGITHTRNAPGSEIMEYAGVEGDTAVRQAEEISRALKEKDKGK